MLSATCSTPLIDRDLKIFILAAAGVVAFLVLFFYFCHPYDLATGMFFAFALGLLARGKLLQYLGVFAMANLNRETTFLLILVFAVFFLFRLSWRQYLLWTAAQLLLFGVTRLSIVALFAGNPGVPAVIEPGQNLEWFLQYPAISLLHWSGFAVLVWLCARKWAGTPRLLQVALAVMGPLLMALYLVAGRAFEIRVFAEAFPAVWVMLWRPTDL